MVLNNNNLDFFMCLICLNLIKLFYFSNEPKNSCSNYSKVYYYNSLISLYTVVKLLVAYLRRTQFIVINIHSVLVYSSRS